MYVKNGLTRVAMEMVAQMQDEDGDFDTETSYVYIKRKPLKSLKTQHDIISIIRGHGINI